MKNKVVPVAENNRRFIAEDEKTSRMILGIGKKRLAFDFTTRVSELAPDTGDQPAPVLAMKRRKPESAG